MSIEFYKLIYIQVGIANLEVSNIAWLGSIHAACPFFYEAIFKRQQEKLGTSVFIMISHASWHMLLYFAFNKQAFMLQIS